MGVCSSPSLLPQLRVCLGVRLPATGPIAQLCAVDSYAHAAPLAEFAHMKTRVSSATEQVDREIVIRYPSCLRCSNAAELGVCCSDGDCCCGTPRRAALAAGTEVVTRVSCERRWNALAPAHEALAAPDLLCRSKARRCWRRGLLPRCTSRRLATRGHTRCTDCT